MVLRGPSKALGVDGLVVVGVTVTLSLSCDWRTRALCTTNALLALNCLYIQWSFVGSLVQYESRVYRLQVRAPRSLLIGRWARNARTVSEIPYMYHRIAI